MKNKNKALFKLIIVCFWATLLFGVYYGYYKWSLRKLIYYNSPSELPNAPKLSPNELLNLGWAHTKENKPVSSYLEFTETKKNKNIYRIGVFGCSFVRGDEVADSLNFVELINKNLRELHMDSIECINFGVGAYGMHQSYLLYQTLGKKYDLDMVIFNPMDIHIDRDASFRYPNIYPYVHARYIIEKDLLKLITVDGDSQLEVVENYAAFFPDDRYIKYDTKIPNYLSPFAAKSFNPFYYKEGGKEAFKNEVIEVYTMMINNMIKDGKKVIFINNDAHTDILAEKVKNPNFSLWKVNPQDVKKVNCFYSSPLCHVSSLGNDYKANFLTNQILGIKTPVPLLNLSSNDSITAIPDNSEIKNRHMTFNQNGGLYYTFVANNNGWSNIDQKYFNDTIPENQHLMMISGSAAFPEFLFLKKPANDMFLVFTYEDNKKDSLKIKFNGNNYLSKVSDIVASSNITLLKNDGTGLKKYKFKTKSPAKTIELRIDKDLFALESQLDSATNAVQVHCPNFYKISSGGDEYVDLQKINPTGTFNYVIETKKGRYYLPLFNYSLQWVNVE
ncbi:MAG: hypothetical protein NT150_06055 [Bacteroidetes bacterium]|nr:hypothetical protein [Bacteroidota bacterium]